ncbi:MAG: selenocysteine-specific translation elongation factor [Chloroflexota bacterium]
MYVIGTAGHVDHGKSLLVEALTGIDPDRLREEKARGMTIDLGFAWLTLPGGRSVSIVDVPGHERFIKNMLAGAGGVDLALLVVAADDGVMPQTREHLAILDLLGVRHGVVALTKRDIVDDDWLALVTNDIDDLLDGTALAGSPVVPCSSITRAGLDDLLAAIESAIDGLPPKRNIGRPRLPIDRVFTIAGFGTVVTGTLIDGELAAGAEIELMPGRLRGRIRGLQAHRDKVERASPGMRTAVNITGIDKDTIRRGLVLAAPRTLAATGVVDVRLVAVAGLPHAVRHNMNVTFHCFADEANAQVRLLQPGDLRPGDSGWAQIKLETPVAVVRGDRFVLRTPNDTIAGGVIADVAPKRHRRGDAAMIAALEVLLSGSPSDAVLAAVGRRPLIDRATLTSELAFSGADVDAALAELVNTGALVLLGDGAGARAVLPDAFDRLTSAAMAVLDAFHREHPLRPGMPLEELRSRLGLNAEAFQLVAGVLRGVTVSGATASLATFRPEPTRAQQQQIAAYLAALRASPGGTDAACEPALRAYLVETGAVVDAGGGVLFEAASFDAMTANIRTHIEQHGAITLAQTRDLIGTSRKYAQALLEHLDRLRVTRRVGDERVLR